MNKTKRVETYQKDKKWCVDAVSLGSFPIIENAEFLGIGRPFEHQYKNGKRVHRWKLAEVASPDEDIWFILKIRIKYEMNTFKMAVKIEGDDLYFEWLSPKLRISTNRVCRNDLCKLDVAYIDMAVQNALSNCGD